MLWISNLAGGVSGRQCSGGKCGQRVGGSSVYQYIYDPEGARIGKTIVNVVPATGASCSAYNPSAVVPGTSTPWFNLQERYLVDSGGNQATELSETSGEAWTHSNVWAGGKHVASYDLKGLHFNIADPLGDRGEIGGEIGGHDTYSPNFPNSRPVIS